jgi:hypothetical protein
MADRTARAERKGVVRKAFVFGAKLANHMRLLLGPLSANLHWGGFARGGKPASTLVIAIVAPNGGRGRVGSRPAVIFAQQGSLEQSPSEPRGASEAASPHERNS